jgi:16S rRNA (cytosine967-C5)-methyltransferase
VNAALRAVSAHPSEYWERVIGHSTTSLRSHPAWIAALLENALAECDGVGELEVALDSHNQAPLVTLCHLPGFSEPEESSTTQYSPLGSTLQGGDPRAVAGVREKVIRVQDEGSQLAALLLTRVESLTPVDTIWDMCAGPGGKTAVLGAEACDVGASVLASEISDHRSSLVEDSTSAIREKFPTCIRTEVGDSRQTRVEEFSRILLDAPCSGLGALRRRPEARWVKTPESISALREMQEALLRNGLDSLAPGGYLAYVTCSPVVEETTGVIQRVVNDDKRLTLLDTPAVLEGIVTSHIKGHRRGTAVQLWTHRHGTDAMFIQLIQRSL